jgi:arabinogalactan endo-1,4-beta-galactosidase
MKTTALILTVCLLAAITACSKGGGSSSGGSSSGGDTTKKPAADTPMIKGSDISWVTQMEDSAYKFYNAAGTAMDCFQLMQSLTINAVRLRIWVNPANGLCGTSDVVAKAVRAHNLGLRILLDFHYSDTWADPGHQTKPAAWTALDFPTLTSTLSNYTIGLLDTLKAAGVVPSWVQIGNETDNGMLWPDGQASTNMANFAALITAGYKAVRSVSDTTQVIVHISNGYDNTTFRWMFDGLTANNAQYDIIGMSLYPTATNWSTYNTSCAANMNDMVSRYNKAVMICEVGMPEDEASTTQSFLTDLIHKVKAVPGGKGLGVFYWEPESYNNWQGYSLGAFDNTGKPTVAMNAFLDN